MTQLTVRQAAERAGISRQTMFRYIEQGRISSTNNRDGQKQIAVSELLRVFGTLQPEPVAGAVPATAQYRQRQAATRLDATAAQAVEIERLRGQLALAEERLALAQERVTELKTQRHDQDAEKAQLLGIIERQTLLLMPPVVQPSETPKLAPKTVTAPKKPPATVQKAAARPVKQQPKTPKNTAPKGRK